MTEDEGLPGPPRRGYVRGGTGSTEIEDRSNATVAVPIVLHNCGLIGSPSFKRTLEPGTRVEIVDELQLGSLYRILFPGSSLNGSLVHAEDVEPDEDSGYGEELTPPAREAPELSEKDPYATRRHAFDELFADRRDR